MRNIETEIQFILESKEYIIDLVEKDFKENKKFCAFTKQKIIKQISWVYNQEIDYIDRNSEDYLDGLDNQQEQN
tara:strand:- start:2350 stop:2571 length:222 start_codon:yes stop_codon:yes gene_type:complete